MISIFSLIVSAVALALLYKQDKNNKKIETYPQPDPLSLNECRDAFIEFTSIVNGDNKALAPFIEVLNESIKTLPLSKQRLQGIGCKIQIPCPKCGTVIGLTVPFIALTDDNLLGRPRPELKFSEYNKQQCTACKHLLSFYISCTAD